MLPFSIERNYIRFPSTNCLLLFVRVVRSCFALPHNGCCGGDSTKQMAMLEAQIRASISNVNSMFAAGPPKVPPAVAAGVAAANDGTASALPKKAKDHTLRYVFLATAALPTAILV